MFSVSQLIAHAVGDYVLQSDWMANEKTKKTTAAVAHVVTYTLPFLLLTQSLVALAVILGSHFIIDRWRLARYICWLKNFMAPRTYWYPWSLCVGTGYHKDRPPWMSVWLMIIADNTLHVICNGLAIYYLGG